MIGFGSLTCSISSILAYIAQQPGNTDYAVSILRFVYCNLNRLYNAIHPWGNYAAETRKSSTSWALLVILLPTATWQIAKEATPLFLLCGGRSTASGIGMQSPVTNAVVIIMNSVVRACRLSTGRVTWPTCCRSLDIPYSIYTSVSLLWPVQAQVVLCVVFALVLVAVGVVCGCYGGTSSRVSRIGSTRRHGEYGVEALLRRP